MFKTTLLTTFATIAAITANCQAQWVDYDSMLNESINAQNQIVQQAEAQGNHAVEQNMNNPQIQQMYRAYQAQGGPMDFRQYCYAYACTAGFQNVQGWVDSENSIAQNEGAANARYREHVNNLWAQTHEEQGIVNDHIAMGRGELLSGNTNYTNPYDGSQTNLPYTAPVGQTYTDYYGNTYTMGNNGNYTYGSNNGYNYEMTPAWGR